MRSHPQKLDRDSGFTLIEAIIYIALLSGLMSSFITYAYYVHEEDLQLLDEINASSQM